MIIRMGLLNRRRDTTPDEFRRYWREVHGPLAARLPGLRAYRQNLVTDRSQLAIDHARGGMDLDGISQLVFDDLAAMEAAASSPAMAPVGPDNDRFAILRGILVTRPNPVVPVAEGPLIKRMSLLRRRPDIDAARFREEWFGFHAEAVSKFPTVAGYTQNLVVARQADGSTEYDALPVDGVVELWFRNVADLQASFSSPAAEVSQLHALDFIAEITTFLVEVHPVLP
ncbi:EthD domain-containing protein [Roseomonas marmotae]|uniref:EthD family reductase n=1 Tax=Roseomonas marmotae TaxID=2768161 RepID=A0ABS3KAZ2_9PROT|nr:EthD family reductase [Roseomonas marmotae]MBO1074617.1 EthD family reductase [Roseomonas marmotae]QTI81640.1 EthD family reductase [Roseomonas marmotae]